MQPTQLPRNTFPSLLKAEMIALIQCGMNNNSFASHTPLKPTHKSEMVLPFLFIHNECTLYIQLKQSKDCRTLFA